MCRIGVAAIAIYCDSSYGPIFGHGHDIRISSGSNANETRSSHFGSSYKHADYKYSTDKARSIFSKLLKSKYLFEQSNFFHYFHFAYI